MKRVVIRRRVILPGIAKRNRKRTARLLLQSIPPPPPALAPDNDFITVLKRRRRPKKKIRISHRRQRRMRLLNELLNLRSRPSSVTTPNVVGIILTSAQSVLHNAGLLDNDIFQPSLTIPANTVIHQDPNAGTPIAYGSTVNLVVSSGAATVPLEIGNQVAQAIADTIALGLLPRISDIPTNSVPPGTVIKQEPGAGERVLIGSPIFFTVAISPLPGADRNQLPSTEDIVSVTTIVQ